MANATDCPLQNQAVQVWFSDPPYYDAVPYSDLSDFFLVWLKRSLPGSLLFKDPFDEDNPLSPKEMEIVQDEIRMSLGKPKDKNFFEEAMGRAFAEGRRILTSDGIG